MSLNRNLFVLKRWKMRYITGWNGQDRMTRGFPGNTRADIPRWNPRAGLLIDPEKMKKPFLGPGKTYQSGKNCWYIRNTAINNLTSLDFLYQSWFHWILVYTGFWNGKLPSGTVALQRPRKKCIQIACYSKIHKILTKMQKQAGLAIFVEGREGHWFELDLSCGAWFDSDNQGLELLHWVCLGSDEMWQCLGLVLVAAMRLGLELGSAHWVETRFLIVTDQETEWVGVDE